MNRFGQIKGMEPASKSTLRASTTPKGFATRIFLCARPNGKAGRAENKNFNHEGATKDLRGLFHASFARRIFKCAFGYAQAPKTMLVVERSRCWWLSVAETTKRTKKYKTSVSSFSHRVLNRCCLL